MTTWTDSLGPESIYDDESGILDGSLFKLGLLAAGVGIAFGVGMAFGGQGSAPPPPPQAAGLLATADARTKTHETIRSRLGFHEALKGHPGTEGNQPTVAPAEKSAPRKRVASAPKLPIAKPPQAPSLAPPTAPAPVAKKPAARPPKVAAEDAPIVIEEGVDALDDEVSASERKVERKDDMAHLRSALLKVLGENTPVWSEDHTPPSLNSQRKAGETIAAKPAGKLPLKKIAKAQPKKVAKPKPAAKAKAVAQPAGAFALQIASIKDRARAVEVAGELKRMGKRVRVVSADVNGAMVHRVQVIGFATRAAADGEKAKLNRGFVVAIPR